MRLLGRSDTAGITRSAALGALIGFALAAAPAGAASPSSTPTPSAQELWRTYPLQATPEPAPSATPRPAHRAPAHAAATHASGGGPGFAPFLMVAALLGAGAALALWYRRPRPRPAVAVAAGPPATLGTRRFQPARDWPVQDYALWHCEIEPDGDRLHAVMCPPGRRRGRVIASSDELAALSATLRAAGWAPVGHGAHWYSARFVWRGDDPPRTRLDRSTPESSEAP